MGIKKATSEMEAVLSGAVSIEDIKQRLANMTIGAKEEEKKFYFCGVCSHIVESLPKNCPVCESSNARFVEIVKEVDFFICDLCSQIAQRAIPDHCTICGAGSETYRKIDLSLLNLTNNQVTWTPEANKELDEIPEGFLRDMIRWRIEVDARKKAISTIDPAVIQAKYQEWLQASSSLLSDNPVIRSLEWDCEASVRVAKIPPFVQGTVIQEIETYAKENGLDSITAQVLDQVTDQWAETIKRQGY